MSDHLKEHSNNSQRYYVEDVAPSLSDVILILARHSKILFIIPMLFCTLMIVYVSFFVDPIYTSTSKIMSSSSGGGLSQAAGLAAQFGIPLSTGKTETKWVYPEIIKSRTLARLVLKRNFNTRESEKKRTLIQILTSTNSKPKLKFETLEILAVNKFLKMINISEDKKTSILTLSINASEPRLAARINKAVIEELDTHQRKYNKAKTSDAKKFIVERIIDIEKELIASEEDLKTFMDRNRRIENSPALQLEQQRLEREVTVLIGVFTTLKQQLETTKIEEVKDSDYVIILDPPEIPMQRSKPNKKRMVLLALFLGLGIGVASGLLLEYLGNNKKEEKDKMNEAKALIIKNFSELFFSKNK